MPAVAEAAVAAEEAAAAAEVAAVAAALAAVVLAVVAADLAVAAAALAARVGTVGRAALVAPVDRVTADRAAVVRVPGRARGLVRGQVGRAQVAVLVALATCHPLPAT